MRKANGQEYDVRVNAKTGAVMSTRLDRENRDDDWDDNRDDDRDDRFDDRD